MSEGKHSVDRIRDDHKYMLELVDRILGSCDERGRVENCANCADTRRMVCHGNIEALIRSFIETTLKHNVLEAMYMEEEDVPHAHRSAHNKAHIAIAEQLKAIRVVFSQEGDCIIAIDGIEEVRRSLIAHFQEFDQQLETLLLAPG